MINKVVDNIEKALEGVESNMTFMVGGFGQIIVQFQSFQKQCSHTLVKQIKITIPVAQFDYLIVFVLANGS